MVSGGMMKYLAARGGAILSEITLFLIRPSMDLTYCAWTVDSAKEIGAIRKYNKK